MHKNFLTYFMVLITLFGCKAQEVYEAKNSIVNLAQNISVYSKNVDWEKVDQEFHRISNGSMEKESLLPALQYLINALGDPHATIRSTENYKILVNYTGPTDQKDLRKSSYVNEVINNIDSKFSCTSKNEVGILKIVGIGGHASVEDEAQAMQDCISNLKNAGINKWIIDLRDNGGGNMNPMIADISPFFKEGFIGGSMNAEGELVNRYEIKNHNFYDTERLVYESPSPIKNCTSDSLVVLLSKYTASSGEIVAVTFKDRPNTIFIGEETAGYTTGNGYQVITDELALIISQNYISDRNHNLYTDKVGVDIEIPFQESHSGRDDQQMQAAINWLLDK